MLFSIFISHIVCGIKNLVFNLADNTKLHNWNDLLKGIVDYSFDSIVYNDQQHNS